MELFRNPLERCGYQKIEINRKTTSFGVKLGQRKEEEGSNKMYQGAGKGRQWMIG